LTTVVKRAGRVTTYYVFEGTEPIFAKKIATGKTKSYIYALGKYLARVDGIIGDTAAKKYFYHTDHLGSIRAVTNQAGKVVYKSDYLAFGIGMARKLTASLTRSMGSPGMIPIPGCIITTPGGMMRILAGLSVKIRLLIRIIRISTHTAEILP
jgi:hypothetical protein